MFGFLPCVLRLGTTMLDAIIVLTEVSCLEDFVEEELAFFLVWWADEILIWHGEDCLEDIHYCSRKLLHAESGENVNDFLS